MAAAVAVSVSVEAAPERCGLEEEEKEEEEGGGREECVANDEPAEEEEEEGGAAALSVGGPGPGAGTQSRLARLPLSRVKALMKMDPDVSLASQESVFAIAKATELFVEMIAKDALVYAQQGKRKTLQRKDLDNAIEAIDEFAFLEGMSFLLSLFCPQCLGTFATRTEEVPSSREVTESNFSALSSPVQALWTESQQEEGHLATRS
ncbi:hypothetical protein Z043_113572 [Scleropages formosus]|uniref:DNA polymerase epsilon subunit 4 n=1 Tax=Scleropages formosus TaxID=113540 RepID=A0A0P7V0M0_SCLFO|nr:hypothetical protein Z043_113572 [Scleropages formosus]